MTRPCWNILSLVIAGALLLPLLGCDSATTDPVVLPPKTVTFEFPAFNVSDVQNGTVQLTSENQEDLESELRADGFTRDEVIRATVTQVQLERRSVGTGAVSHYAKVFDFLVDGAVGLTQSGRSPLTIAQKSSFDPSVAETTLNIVSSNATAFVANSGPFRSRLTLTVDEEEIGPGDFRVAVSVTFRVEVEGV